jgi:hypothetical protein
MASKPGRTVETLDPARNFTLTTEDRVRAVASGPPAYMRRRRAIEDLEEGIVRVLVDRCVEAVARGAGHGDLAAHAQANAPMRALERLNDLIERHNRYYPIEANLPLHPRTGELMDRTGEPWRPMKPRSIEELVRLALVRACG